MEPMTESATAVPPPSDLPPAPAGLDDIEGDRALAWVAERNAAALAAVEGSERFEAIRTEVETILDSSDRIPTAAQADGLLYNFWTDTDHPRGLWRRTTWESYRAGAPGRTGRIGGVGRADGNNAPGTPSGTSRTGAPSGTGNGSDEHGDDGPSSHGDDGNNTGTRWEVLLDLDALGEAEGVTWVWHGARVLRTGPLAGKRALVNLSDGGSDTDITRELDLGTGRFIPPAEGGFHREASKGSLVWADDDGDSVLAVADLGRGSLSPAGYPRQVRRMRRGQQPTAGEVLLTAAVDDDGAWAHRDRWGRTWLLTHPDFHTEELWLLPDGARTLPPSSGPTALADTGTTVAPGAVHIDVPSSAQATAAWEWLLVSLREDWEIAGAVHRAGSLLAAPLDAFLSGERTFETLFAPTSSAFLTGFTMTAHHLVLTLLDDCVPTLEVLTPPGGADDGSAGWMRRPLDLSALDGGPCEPTSGTGSPGSTTGPAPAADPTALRPGRPLIEVSATAIDGREGDRLWLTTSSFTRPTTLMAGELDIDGRLTGVEVLRAAPDRFDATGIEVGQHVAVSSDGTRVPYFQVGRPVVDDEGRAVPGPTILYGYGGFEVPLGVGYMPVIGKAWLERGGTYVIANIRGGGEYGPAWHRAGLKEHRHRVYEDFAAVARALSERGVTTPDRLAVHGGSNGGLLVGMMLTRYPELVGAVLCEVPLLDMSRYTHLLAGASWEAEYGDPDDPAQWEFIRDFSPFHLLRRGRDYPPVLLMTSTRDDRVHPAHARTMAHRLECLGQTVTYFENSEGGHGRASTNAQRALMSALTYDVAWRTLTPSAS